MSDDRPHDLLTDPIFSTSFSRQTGPQVTLPGLLARLSAGEDIELAALQPHQQHPWHAFLVQLAALALPPGETELPDEESTWRGLLLDLTDGAVEPWCLVVPDLDRPAFFQPPVPEGSLAAFKNSAPTPDTIDVLVTTRNHDVKTARMTGASPEHWAYALATLQTMEGYSGKFNYGIVRMNSGYGNRPAVAITRDLGWSRRVSRDVEILRAVRGELVNTYGYAERGGHSLLWVVPWSGEEGLALGECDPFFIEICRRIRLDETSDGIVARVGSSRCQRIVPGETNGDTGDIWTPVRKEDGAALTVGAKGFSYDLMQELLFSGAYELGAAAKLSDGSPDAPWLVARAFARGQKTEGFHERLLPIPPSVRRLLGRPDERERLGLISRRRVETVAELRKRVLRPALLAVLQAGTSDLDMRDDRPQVWLQRLDRGVDRIFFDRLWASLEAESPEEADRRWTREVIGLAREVLEDAIQSCPFPSVRRYRAIAQAERLFEGAAWNRFGDALGNDQGDKDAGDRRSA